MRNKIEETLVFLEKEDTQWLTAKGKVLEISEMDNNHIKNAVGVIRRQQKHFETKLIIPDLMMERYLTFKMSNPEYFI